MGRHIMNKTGNVAAVQRQLGHKNAAYSLQYARITDAELQTWWMSAEGEKISESEGRTGRRRPSLGLNSLTGRSV